MPQNRVTHPRRLPLLTCVGLAVVATAATQAAATLPVFPSDPFIQINVSNSSTSGSFNVPLASPDVQTWDLGDQYYIVWGTTGPVSLGGIATLIDMQVVAAAVLQPDGNYRWGIGTSFNVQAGSEDTNFELISPVIGFDPLSNIFDATTSASLGGSDQNANGLSITPTGGGGSFGFAALLNANSPATNYPNVAAALAGSSLFRSHFSTAMFAGAGGSVGGSGNMGIPFTLTDTYVDPNWSPGNPNVAWAYTIQSLFSFRLSAGDQAGGTSDFSVPAPTAASLLGLAGVLAARRRRR